MKLKTLLIAFAIQSMCFGQNKVKNYQQLKNKVILTLTDGSLTISPLASNSIRVQYANAPVKTLPELILTSKVQAPVFNVTSSSSTIEISTSKIKVVVNKATAAISYRNSNGVAFLQEKPNSRLLISNSNKEKPSVKVEQSFESSPDEVILGLGQFQDGHFNLKDVTRNLTQVNSQIAIPFIYSNKGYGLLWHQYGMTDFNPADSSISIEKEVEKKGSSENLADATTANGTQKVNQHETKYSGKFVVAEDGKYSIMLDLGNMGNRHFLSIDGNAIIDQRNHWLPPTVSSNIFLKKGEHSIQVICKVDNNPKVSYKLVDGLTTFRSPDAKLLDYVVFYGPDADQVISSYRNLSGNVPMLPLWAFGFWQCRERYSSSAQLIETVKEFRSRKIPVDVIVQDWQYWGKYGWGAMKFDETYYPDPKALMDELHSLNANFNISVWENLDKKSEVGKSYVKNNYYIPDSPWVDVSNPAARKAHWDAMNKTFFSQGVDSWWLDATEPENDALHGKKIYLGSGDTYRLTYPLFVNQAVYEGQRQTSDAKRVCILTRSAFAGQQRYGTINWSGDVGSTWDAYVRQIKAGLNYAVTGMPYWTTDIGGFFRPKKTQYTDEKYHELLMRWYQWGVFNPIFRVHGYQSETEPWKFSPVVEANIRELLALRYRLIPYIYSQSWQIHKKGSTLMRPLVMDFRQDEIATLQQYEYMFGSAFLIAPVTQAGVVEKEVYLPKSVQWYHFWSGKRFEGGQKVNVAAPLNQTPVFVKAGSIIPMGEPLQYVTEKKADTLEIRIYKGANGSFELYEDEGNNYNYEKGQYATIPFKWNEQQKSLTIGDRVGDYKGSLKKRVFNIVWVDGSKTIGAETSSFNQPIVYNGKKIVINPN